MWLITGTSGFIGSQVLKFWNEQGVEEIVACDLVPPDLRPLNTRGHKVAQWIPADLLLEKLRGPLNGKIQAIVHMGANSSTTETSWENLERWNLSFTKELWKYSVSKAIPFLYASSAATYGDGAKGYSDSTPAAHLKALNLYGESKRLFDQFVENEAQKPNHYWGVKFFNVYGPGEFYKGDMASVVYKAFFQIRQTGRLRLFKSYRPEYAHGEQRRDFVYVKDVVQWMWQIIQQKLPNGIYNMGYGKARSWNDLAKSVFAAMEKAFDVEYIDMPESLREKYQYFTEADMSRSFARGLRAPSYSLEDGVADYIKNHLSALKE